MEMALEASGVSRQQATAASLAIVSVNAWRIQLSFSYDRYCQLVLTCKIPHYARPCVGAVLPLLKIVV